MSYRGMENTRHQMTRPKGRGGMFKHGEQMQTITRARFVPALPLGQQSPYQSSVTYTPRTGTYPTIHSPDFQAVQYPPQVSATPVWSPPIPMSEAYQISNQHTYPPQQQIYNADTSHIMAIQNTTYVSQVQNQNDFDPITNTCICSKCGFHNVLAHIQLKNLSEENKRLQEQLNAERQQNANYEESVRSSPASQATVSSLSVDAQPFHMAAQGAKPPQGANTNTETSAEVSNRLHNPNGNDFSHRTAPRSWQSHGDTPVVSASDVVSNQFNEATTPDPEWNNVPDHSHPDGDKTDTSDQHGVEDTAVNEPASMNANEEWDMCESSQQEANVVQTASGPFRIQDKQDENTLEKEHTNCNPHGDGYGPAKNDKNSVDTPKSRPKERTRLNRHKGGRNEVPENNRENESRRSMNHRGPGGYRPPSPQDQKDKRMEKSAEDSRESSRSRMRSGSEYSERKDSQYSERKDSLSGDGGVKTFESSERLPSEKRLDSGDRTYSHNRGDSRDGSSRRSGGNMRRYNDQGGKGRPSDGGSWRHETPDMGDKREFSSRSGGRGGSSASRRMPPGISKISEVEGDLFTASDEFSLAHCVAEDLRMGSGIAVRFRQQFKNVDELFEQRKYVGEVALLQDKERFIFYLITKEHSNGKPRWDDFSNAVLELKRLCVEKGVKLLAMPRIGCGLDRLEWRDVRRLLETTFAETSVAVTVYNFQQNEESESPSVKSKSSLYLMHERKNLADIYSETGILFLWTEEFGTLDKTVESLNRKHNILQDLRNSKKVVGDVITIQKGKEYLYGLVVKKTERDPFSYVNFGKCLRKLRNLNSKDQYGYFGMEAFRDGNDPMTMEKVITCTRNIFGGIPYKMEFYICWPKDLENDHIWEEHNITPSSK